MRSSIFCFLFSVFVCSASLPASAAVSFVGQATGTNTCTLPTFNAGDIGIVFAYRDGSNTAPSLPSGWTNINSSGSSTNSSRIGFRVLQSGDTSCGTWTNATSTIVHVYRGQLAAYAASSPAIPNNAGSNGVSTTVTYPALTMRVANGSSWVAGFAGHRSVDTSLETAPTGMTNRSNVVDATDEAAGHDTNGGVSSWSAQNVSVGGTSSGWRSWTIELEAEPADAPDFRSVASAAGGFGTSITINRPSGVVENDVMVAILYRENTAEAITPPSNWTEITGASGNETAVSPAYQHRAYWKRATASEPASYTWMWTSTLFADGSIVAYSGVEQTGNPVDASSFNASSASGTAVTATGITTSVAATLLLCLVSNNGSSSTVTQPTDMGERWDAVQDEGSDRAQAAAGSTGNRSATLSAASGWAASLVALLPETGAPPAAQPPLRRLIIFSKLLDALTPSAHAQSRSFGTERQRFPAQFRPTPMEHVREALKLAKVREKDVVYDLGSGDGRVVGLAVRSFGARKGVGVEIVERLVEQARKEWPEAKFIHADFRDVDISDATVVYVWIGSTVGYQEAWKHIARWCKPGTRVLMPRGRPAPAGPALGGAGFKLLRSSEHFDLWELGK